MKRVVSIGAMLVVVSAGLSWQGPSARASMMDNLPEVLLILTADNPSGTAVYQVTKDQGTWNESEGTWDWVLSGDVELYDGPVHVATLSDDDQGSALSFSVQHTVVLNFLVTAGGSDTSFTITSALLSFPTVDPALGAASVGFTITDVNGDGATLEGLVNGSAGYLAQYNGLVPGGQTFAALLTDFSAGAFASETLSERMPLSGFDPIGSPVSDMSTQIKFRLSAHDAASGTSAFTIVPEPTTITLLALGLVGRCCRRR